MVLCLSFRKLTAICAGKVAESVFHALYTGAGPYAKVLGTVRLSWIKSILSQPRPSWLGPATALRFCWTVVDRLSPFVSQVPTARQTLARWVRARRTQVSLAKKAESPRLGAFR